jgi:cytoskeletal protein CcmA (bactofilin family)
MGSTNKQLDPKAETIVGLGTVVIGEISVPELLVVEGTVEGNVKTKTLRVGANGVIKGKVFASNADIHGVLSEDVEIEDFLLLRSTSRTEGHVKCGNVQVERGAAIKGDFWTGVDKSAESQAEVNVNNVEPFPSTSVSTDVDRSTTRRKRPNEPKAPVDQYSPLVIRRKIDFNKRPMAVGGAVAATQGTSPSHGADILPRRDGEP